MARMVLLITLICCGCKSSYFYSYEDEKLPVFIGDYRNAPDPTSIVDQALHSDSYSKSERTIKVVSYNIEFAINFEKAIEILTSEELIEADVLLLQEMDEGSTDSIARHLDMCYVYYPAIDHPGVGKKVGNAILSKWPIVSHRKVKLPHPSLYPMPLKFKNYKFRKLATVAQINLNGQLIHFYSTHAAAFNTTKNRNDIAIKISEDARKNGYKYCIIGGDFNAMGNADLEATVGPFRNRGFQWSTEGLGQTIGNIRWFLSFIPKRAFKSDHIFTLGFSTLDSGKIEAFEISDHSPVWVDLSYK